MSHTLSLQQLFQQQMPVSSLDQLVYSYLIYSHVGEEELEKEIVWQETLFSTEKTILNWKRLLTVQGICYLDEKTYQWLPRIVRYYYNQPWNQSSQYFRVLVALNHILAKVPVPEIGIHLLESGAALLDLKEYRPWLSFPQTPYHLEFGLFLCLYALLTDKKDSKEQALKLAHWQLNTLNGKGELLNGLFVKEKNKEKITHEESSYLLFRAASCLEANHLFSIAAEKSLKNINEKKNSINPLWAIIEKWLDKYPVVKSVEEMHLPEHIYDPSTALVGYRSAKQHAICTLHGSYTGLGSLRQNDVEIINYGPQSLPLCNCEGFGIEGNALSDQGIRRSTIESHRYSFALRGCTRLVDQEIKEEGNTSYSQNIWLEVTQEFKKPHFYLQTNYLGLDGWKETAFSFFVKAKSCHVKDQIKLLPGTLNRYEGPAQTVSFEGEQPAIDLRILAFEGTMQIIPLGGGHDFWGADFLVAYLLHPQQSHYQWHIEFK